jgi:hypothetical protein
MASLATLQGWLAEAEEARHARLLGRREISVQNGTGNSDTRVQYMEMTPAELAAYIDDLKRQIRAAGGTASGSPRRAIVPELGGDL